MEDQSTGAGQKPKTVWLAVFEATSSVVYGLGDTPPQSLMALISTWKKSSQNLGDGMGDMSEYINDAKKSILIAPMDINTAIHFFERRRGAGENFRSLDGVVFGDSPSLSEVWDISFGDNFEPPHRRLSMVSSGR
jgi:hypothetical protein